MFQNPIKAFEVVGVVVQKIVPVVLQNGPKVVVILCLVNFIDQQCEVEVVVVCHLSIRKMHKMTNNINKVSQWNVLSNKKDWFAVRF